MEDLMKYILEKTTTGNIEKKTAAQILKNLQDKKQNINEDIAIIGIDAQLPVVQDDIAEYWNNVKNRIDFITKLPESRKTDVQKYLEYIQLSEEEDIDYIEGGFLPEVDKFDYKLFRMTPKEAKMMDPFQRIFLQVAWNTIEDAGYGGKKLNNSKTGVYVGFASNIKDSYARMILNTNQDSLLTGGLGNITAMLPSRISYLLNLKGPSMVIDTACSSALLSVHKACQAINSGECDTAIAGALRINLLPYDAEYLRFGNESSDYRTRTFDYNSDGAGVGEGILAVMLKPLKQAMKDRDNIYGVIKGSAANQDGTTIGLTAPNPDSQSEVISEAWKNANINPESLSYIETHGTGTALGDPLELEGLEKAFRKYTDKKQICAIGSVKPNLGHLFEASGLASLIKCIHILNDKVIPPNLYFNRPNKQFDIYDSPFYVNDRLRKWESKQDQDMYCGISSFGFSGTNCHLVMGEAPKLEVTGDKPKMQLFSISAKNQHVLRQFIGKYISFLSDKGREHDIGDICYTTNTGRTHFECRLILMVSSVEELTTKLQKWYECKDYEVNQRPGEYYSEHKVVSSNKEHLLPGEIYKRQKSAMEREGIEALKSLGKSSHLEKEALLHDLCQLYIQGADLDWETMYQSQAVKKVSLPGYPFEKTRCWIDVPERVQEHRISGNSDQYFAMKWKPQALEQEEKIRPQGSVLIFKDEQGLADQIAERYRDTGVNVITVTFENEFMTKGDNSFSISGQEDDYIELFNAMNHDISQIIHLSTLKGEEETDSLEQLIDSQQKGVYSLSYLTRALHHHQLDQEIKLVLLSNYGTEVDGTESVLRPENASMFGFAKVLHKEQANIHCRAIDLDDHTSVDSLVKEIEAETDVFQVSYRHGVRYVEEFSEVDMEQVKARNISIKENGTYLITGGMGGIGLEISKYIATQKSVNLVFINRSAIPDRNHWNRILDENKDETLVKKIKNIKAIEDMGSTVTTYSADVANMSEMKSVISDVHKRLGQITGVVHGAGVGGSDLIIDRTKEEFEAVFTPKVYGTWILDRLTREDHPELFIMFSSIATLFDAPGQSDYIAANAYLDAYSHYYRKNNQASSALTINWSTWKETGMSVSFDFTMDTLFKAILTKDAVKGFDKALQKDVPQVLIGEINYESKMLSLIRKYPFNLSSKINKNLVKRIGKPKEKNTSYKSTTGKLVLTGRQDGNYTDLELLLGETWSEVLGFNEIDIYDNFYEIGGDSISGFKIVSKMIEVLKIDIDVHQLFNYVTIHDFAKYVEELLDHAKTGAKLIPIPEQEHYPVSSAQKRLFFLHEMDKQNTSYNLNMTTIIEGKLNIERLKQSFQEIINRHEILRTTFELKNDEPVQIVHSDIPFNPHQISAEEYQLDEFINEFNQPFDLSNAPLFKCCLVKISPEKHVLILNMHHIIADGVSIDVLVNEFAKLYQGEKVPKLKIQYKDYVIWKNKMAEQESFKELEEYWHNSLKGNLPTLQLPTDFLWHSDNGNEGIVSSLELSKAITDNVYTLSKKTGSTLYMVLLAAFNVLLSKYSAQEDIIVGSPTAGRHKPELQNLIGVFINTIAIRNYPKWDKTFRSFLQEVQQNSVGAFENQDYPFEDLVSTLNVKRQKNRNPLFDVVFVLQNVGVSEIEVDGLQFTPYHSGSPKAEYDVYLEAIEKNGFLHLQLIGSSNLFKPETIESMLEDYIIVLDSICSDVDIKIGDISMKNRKKLNSHTTNEEDVDLDHIFDD